VTAVEAGLFAIAIAAAFAVRTKGPAAVAVALADAAVQTGRVALLIAAAAPVGFLFATSGVDVAALLPQGPAITVLLAAAALCLLIGTALDVGAAILLVLPVLVPAAAAAGADPVHAALVLTVALLLGGLTPPVGMLVLVVKDVTGTGGVYRAIVPYLLALAAALGIILAVPAISVGLVRLL
jgi:TRAP-type C4-dicarboxylate transport system permease large subunit